MAAFTESWFGNDSSVYVCKTAVYLLVNKNNYLLSLLLEKRGWARTVEAERLKDSANFGFLRVPGYLLDLRHCYLRLYDH